MAHLVILENCPSFVNGDVIGTMQQRDLDISNRKYPVQSVRKGYNQPHISSMVFKNYRVKKEIIPQLVKDMSCKVFNPIPNNIRFIDLLRDRPVGNETSIGKSFRIILYLFKWFNRLKLNKLTGLEPVPVDDTLIGQRFNEYWTNCYCFGMLKDRYIDDEEAL